MEPTQEQLNSYAQTLCNLKAVREFLSSVKCNPDGTFSVLQNDGCCYSSKSIPTEELLAIINTAQTQELIDAINDLDLSIDGGIQVADLQPIIDASNCICETLRDNILPLLEPGFTAINNNLTNIVNNTAPLETTFTEIRNNTLPLSNIETLLQQLLNDVQEPYVVDYIPITEFLTSSRVLVNGPEGYSHGGNYPITDWNSIPAYNGGVNVSLPVLNDPLDTAGIRHEGIMQAVDSNGVNVVYDVTIGVEIGFIATALGDCNQTMIKAWSDGTFTDLADNPVDITTVQDNAGWCRSGLIPNAWNTPYTPHVI